MSKFETEVLEILRDIRKELRGLAVDADFQEHDPAPKKQRNQDGYDAIGSDLESTFSHEIFQYIEVQDNGNKVQIIQFIGYGDEAKKKWKAVNSFLRDAGYIYHPVKDALGYWEVK